MLHKLVSLTSGVFLVLFSVCFFASCSSSKNETREPDVERTQGKSVQPQILPQKTISPNTVQLQAVITAYDGTVQTCRFRIVKILGYGAATPHLAVGTEMIARLVESAYNKEDKDSRMAGFIQSSDPANLNLRHVSVLGQQSGEWTIIKLF